MHGEISHGYTRMNTDKNAERASRLRRAPIKDLQKQSGVGTCASLRIFPLRLGVFCVCSSVCICVHPWLIFLAPSRLIRQADAFQQLWKTGIVSQSIQSRINL
jgi:hypothetical protein